MKCADKDCWYHKNEMLPGADSLHSVYILSIHEGVRTIDAEMMAHFVRTVKRKCPNGHISLDSYVVIESAFPEPPPKTPDTSVKRYHRRGFKGHAVRTYERPPIHPPEQSNHQRHLANRPRATKG